MPPQIKLPNRLLEFKIVIFKCSISIVACCNFTFEMYDGHLLLCRAKVDINLQFVLPEPLVGRCARFYHSTESHSAGFLYYFFFIYFNANKFGTKKWKYSDCMKKYSR